MKIFIALMFLLLPFGAAGLAVDDDSAITRIFPDDKNIDEDIIITISVFIDEEFTHSIYAIEETIPAGLVVTDNGDAVLTGNTLRWVAINEGGLSPVDLTYAVSTSQVGSYIFNGVYVIDGMEIEGTILGPNNLTTNLCTGHIADTDNDCMLTTPELIIYYNDWKSGADITIRELISIIFIWLMGGEIN